MAEENKNVTKKEDISTFVLNRIRELETSQGLTFPDGYNPSNELKAFQLELPNVKDRDGKPALEVCTPASIANAMLYMVEQGLRISTKQCYPIVYKDQLTLQRSYFGSEAVAKRVCPYLDQKPWHPTLVWEGEEFEIGADEENGGYTVVKHKPNLDAIDSGKLKAAYLRVYNTEHKVIYTEVMTAKQIMQAWKQSKNTTNNMFQTNFVDQAAIRTIIGRTAKRYINTANIKDENLAKAISETADENFEDVTPKFTEEEMQNRKDILNALASLPTPIHEEDIVKSYKGAETIDDIPTEYLTDILKGETEGA